MTISDSIDNQYRRLVDLEVPALLIQSALTDDLHEVFQRLNQGTRLDDLDLLAADWSTIRAEIEKSDLDPGIRKQLIAFAQDRISGTYSQEDYEYIPESDPRSTHLASPCLTCCIPSAATSPRSTRGLSEAWAPTRIASPSSSPLSSSVAASDDGRSWGRPTRTSQDRPGRDVSRFPIYLLAAAKDVDAAFTRLNNVQAGDRLRGRLGLIQAATYLASIMALWYQVEAAAGKRLIITPRESNEAKRLRGDPHQARDRDPATRTLSREPARVVLRRHGRGALPGR